MTGPAKRLVSIKLDERTIGRGTPDIEHERAVAIYDLCEDNSFALVGHDGGPYTLGLSIADNRLVFEISQDEAVVMTHVLSLSPFRRIVRDYWMICESYYAAIRQATPQQIETIDMARRGVHNEGSDVLRERLEGKITVDHDTARRLFTLISVLHWKG
jgi:uncharacterized protein (UPF0262 family)